MTSRWRRARARLVLLHDGVHLAQLLLLGHQRLVVGLLVLVGVLELLLEHRDAFSKAGIPWIRDTFFIEDAFRRNMRAPGIDEEAYRRPPRAPGAACTRNIAAPAAADQLDGVPYGAAPSADSPIAACNVGQYVMPSVRVKPRFLHDAAALSA